MRKALVIVGQDAEVVMDIVGEDMEVEGGGTAAAALNVARGNQEVRLLCLLILYSFIMRWLTKGLSTSANWPCSIDALAALTMTSLALLPGHPIL